MKGKIMVGKSFLIFCDEKGKHLCMIGSRYLDDVETAIKTSRHLAEIQNSEVREVILGDLPPQDEDNRTL